MIRFPIIILLPVLLLVACNDKPTSTARVSASSPTVMPLTVEQVLVPEGAFIRGSDREDDLDMRRQYGFPAPLFVDEHPQKKVSLAAFKIDLYEVSNAQFKTFIQQTRRMLPYAWMSSGYAMSREQLETLDVDRLRLLATDHFQLDMDTREMTKPALIVAMLEQQKTLDKLPVTGVNWFAADAFCRWRDGRLPSEAEWEKAARGPNGLEYPWGNDWDPTITNTGDDADWEEDIAPVGSYPGNKSFYGAYDMSGNVWEWVADWYQAYEGASHQSEAFGKHNRVLRGGGGTGHYAISYFFRGATRQFSEPEMESEDVGFRCVSDV